MKPTNLTSEKDNGGCSESTFKGENLIFLISLPRSGSTLLQRILAGHPKIHTVSEPWVLLHPMYAFKKTGIQTEYDASLAYGALSDFMSVFPEGNAVYIEAIRRMAETLYRRALDLSGKPLFLDKTPRYYHIIPELYRVFPAAKFIFLLRNPLAVLSSVLKSWFDNRVELLAKSTNSIDILRGPGLLVDGIEKTGKKAIVVHYEKIVNDPKTEVSRICEKLEIQFIPEMLEYGRQTPLTGRFGDTIGIAKHSRPVTENRDKWIDNLSTEGLIRYSKEYLATLGSELVSSLGYPYATLIRKLEDMGLRQRNAQSAPAKTSSMTSKRRKALMKNQQKAASNPINETLQVRIKEMEAVPPVINPRYLVSAIVSTYNAERFMRCCLEDLEAQTIADRLEIIVVNSGSQQNEEAIVKEFQKRYTNIQYMKSEKRETVYSAWNRAIRAARGKYITNANTDDRHRKDAFEVMVNILETLPEIALVYADVTITETENETFDHCTPVGYFRWMNWNRQDLLHKGCFMGPQPMWRADVHREYGTFDESFVASGDYEFWLRISQTNEFLHIPVMLGLYLRSAGSIEHRNRARQQKENDKIYRMYVKAHAEKKIIGRLAEPPVAEAASGPDRENRSCLPAATAAGVSVVIAATGSRSQLKKCLDSVRKQAPEAHEILIVDRRTAAAAPKWLQQLVKNDPRRRIVQAEKGSGPAAMRNCGMLAATGEHILLLSCDGALFESALADMLACLASVPEAGIVGPMTNRADGIQQIAPRSDRTKEDPAEFASAFRGRNRHRWIRCDRLEGFCMLFHRNLCRQIGLLDETLDDGAVDDLDFCIRASIAGYTNAIAGDVYVHRTGRQSRPRSMKDLNRKWPVGDIRSETGKKFLTLLAVEKGWRAFEKGDCARGKDIFLEGIKLSPDSPSVYYRFAECLINAGCYQDALEVLGEMPVISDDLRRIELEGYANEGLENHETAAGLADQALVIDLDSAAAINLKGMLAHRKGAVADAEASYHRAIERAPGYGDPYTNLGVLLWENDPEQALELFEKAFILDPCSNDIAGNYHTAIAALQRYARAEIAYREAAGAFPDNKNICYKTVDVLLKQERYACAMALIESAIARFGIDEGIVDAALAVRNRLGPDQISTAHSNKDTISLCMIVKNEENDIGRCLHSIKSAVDEMIVVDTGSDDRTQDIARVFGAQVYEMKWAEDFAAARNAALDKASGAWTFHLDADEVVARQDHQELRKLARKPSGAPRAYIFNTRNYTFDANQVGWEANDGRYGDEEAGSGWTPSEKVRLFPRDDRIRFEFPVHELVEPSLKRCGIAIKKSSIPIHHYGKLNQPKSVAKRETYYAIGRKKLAQMGDDAVALRELAIQAEILGRHDESLELWERFLVVVPDNPQAYINMGISHCRAGNFKALLETAEKALALNPQLKEAHYNFALANLHLARIDEAADALEKLLAQVGAYPPAQFLLAAAYSLSERKVEAVNVFRQLQQSAIGSDLAVRCRELAKGFRDTGRIKYAQDLLEAAMDSGLQSKELLDMYSSCLKATAVGDLPADGNNPSGGLSGQISRSPDAADLELGSRVST